MIIPNKDALVQAGEMMSSKEYSEGSENDPKHIETRARWAAVFAQLEKERDEFIATQTTR